MVFENLLQQKGAPASRGQSRGCEPARETRARRLNADGCA